LIHDEHPAQRDHVAALPVAIHVRLGDGDVASGEETAKEAPASDGDRHAWRGPPATDVDAAAVGEIRRSTTRIATRSTGDASSA
jgi:hypothetical protein